MFLAVVHKSKRVDTSRTGGNRLVGGWKLEVESRHARSMMLRRVCNGKKYAERWYKFIKYGGICLKNFVMLKKNSNFAA